MQRHMGNQGGPTSHTTKLKYKQCISGVTFLASNQFSLSFMCKLEDTLNDSVALSTVQSCQDTSVRNQEKCGWTLTLISVGFTVYL